MGASVCPVQRVIRPDLNFADLPGSRFRRRSGPATASWRCPRARTSRVKSIVSFDGDLARALPPMSVTVTLEDEIDISRGDMLAAAHQPPVVATNFRCRGRLDERRAARSGQELFAQAYFADGQGPGSERFSMGQYANAGAEPAATLELNTLAWWKWSHPPVVAGYL